VRSFIVNLQTYFSNRTPLVEDVANLYFIPVKDGQLKRYFDFLKPGIQISLKLFFEAEVSL